MFGVLRVSTHVPCSLTLLIIFCFDFPAKLTVVFQVHRVSMMTGEETQFPIGILSISVVSILSIAVSVCYVGIAGPVGAAAGVSLGFLATAIMFMVFFALLCLYNYFYQLYTLTV